MKRIVLVSLLTTTVYLWLSYVPAYALPDGAVARLGKRGEGLFRAFRENGSLKITTDSEQTTWKLPITHDIPRSTGSQFGIGQT